MQDNFSQQILDKLIEGIPADVMLGSLERAGMETTEFVAALNAVHRSRRESAKAREISRAHAYWMIGIRRRLSGGGAPTVRSVQTLSASEFYKDYYTENRPLLFEDADAAHGWSFERIKSELGNSTIEVMRGRTADPIDPDLSPAHHRESLQLGDYIDEILAGKSHDSYLTAKNEANAGDMGKVLENFRPLPDIIPKHAELRSKYLFMGPDGAVSPLHYDRGNAMLVEMLGSKRCVLYAPHDYCFMYEGEMRVSQVDLTCPNQEKFPLFKLGRPCEVIVPPGGALFIPAGWWHFVESLEPTLSISITTFLVPNAFPPDAF